MGSPLRASRRKAWWSINASGSAGSPWRCKIARCRIETGLEHRKAACGERRIVGQVAHPQRDIEVLADQVDAARRQVELERDRRVARDEVGERLPQHVVRKIGRHRDAEPSARLHLPLLRQGGGGIDFGHHLVRMLEHAAAEVGDGQLARRSQQQAFAELRLEVGDAPRHGRLRLAGALGGAAEAAFVDDAREQQEVVGFEGGHGSLSCLWNDVIHLTVFRNDFGTTTLIPSSPRPEDLR
jgi:hypothetical protein